MAKKKAAKAKTVRRRRSVGAINKGVILQAAYTIGGYVAASMLQAKVLPNVDPKIKGLATVAIGTVVLPMVVKSDMGKQIGIGMAVSGGVEALKSFGVLSGLGATAFLASPRSRLLAGSGVNTMVAGGGVNSMVAGGGINQTVGKYSRAMNTALKYG